MNPEVDATTGHAARSLSPLKGLRGGIARNVRAPLHVPCVAIGVGKSTCRAPTRSCATRKTPRARKHA